MSVYGKLPENWVEVELHTISAVITDGAHSSPKSQKVGRYMCSVKDMTYNKFDFSNTKLISEEDFQHLVKQGCKPQQGDLLISKDGANCLDLLFLYSQEEEIVLLSSIAIVRLNNTISKEYVRYFLLSPDCQFIMKNNYVSGSAIPRVVLKDFKKAPIAYPPLNEQKAIASVLSSLDDKIDLLHRQNKTLESMAETLFRHWFIEEGQKQWKEKSLSEIATFTNGLACQKFPAVIGEASLPVLKIKELSSGITNESDRVTANVKPEYIVHHGDVIFAWSASLMVKIWAGSDCVLNQHLFNVKSDKYPKWFYYEWCKFHLKEFISISESHATTMGHIKRKDLDEAIVKIPSDREIKMMSTQIEPFLNQKIEKLKQIQTLENLRDTLLPKLMSGEVRVRYAEEAMASAI